MNEILGSDLMCDDSGDLVIKDGDFETVEGMPCLNQDLSAACDTFPGDDLDSPFEGILPPTQISDSVTGRARIVRAYKDLLSSDPRIVPESVSVSQATAGESASFAASFETIDNQIVENFVL
jgi:hypothetical protein